MHHQGPKGITGDIDSLIRTLEIFVGISDSGLNSIQKQRLYGILKSKGKNKISIYSLKVFIERVNQGNMFNDVPQKVFEEMHSFHRLGKLGIEDAVIILKERIQNQVPDDYEKEYGWNELQKLIRQCLGHGLSPVQCSPYYRRHRWAGLTLDNMLKEIRLEKETVNSEKENISWPMFQIEIKNHKATVNSEHVSVPVIQKEKSHNAIFHSEKKLLSWTMFQSEIKKRLGKGLRSQQASPYYRRYKSGESTIDEIIDEIRVV